MKTLDRTQYPELGFGKHFAPKMVQAFWSRKKGWSNFDIVPFQNIPVHPGASVVQYGQSIFEGMKAFLSEDKKSIRIFRSDYHSARFDRSAKRVCLPTLPDGQFIKSVNEISRECVDFIPDRPGESLYLRPTLLGTEGFLGVRPADEVLFLLLASPVGAYYSKGFSPVKILIETHHVRAAPGGLGAAKTGANYAASLAAAEQAKAKGYDQVLWLDAIERRFIEEVGTMNVFFRLKDEIVTPPLSDTILAGCTRDTVLQLLRESNQNIVERSISIEELKALSQSGELLEAFGTGTAAIISQIATLETNDRTTSIQLSPNNFKLGPELFKRITTIQTSHSHREDWITTV